MELTDDSALTNGRRARWYVDTDGTPHAWIIDPDRDAPTYCACPQCVSHDQLGPLPNRYRQRLRRCGAPCRNQVAQPADHCRWHRGPTR